MQLRKAVPLLALVAVVSGTAGTATAVAAMSRSQSPLAPVVRSAPSGGAGQAHPDRAPAAAASVPAPAVAAATLDVDDQTGDGRTVLVDEAAVSGSGHVAVFAPDGRLLGSSPVSGITGPTVVRLDEPVTGPTQLRAVLYADDGDGTFDPAKDPRVVDDDGDLEDEGFDYAGR
jgi:hypothetical protein